VLPEQIKSVVLSRALSIRKNVLRECAELADKDFLESIRPERIDQIVERFSDVRCPFLDEHDRCLIYEHRPLACRLEGIPMVDLNDGLFGDWCEMNFTGGVTPGIEEDFRLDYYEIQNVERAATAYLAQRLTGQPQDEVTLFIASALALFDKALSRSLP
jgi:Fe-S-cluster containining protein